MPTSSSRKRPLLPTYRIERELIAEHNDRMRRARQDYGSQVPICPDHYKPCRGECNEN
jgi:hypothetical protein